MVRAHAVRFADDAMKRGRTSKADDSDWTGALTSGMVRLSRLMHGLEGFFAGVSSPCSVTGIPGALTRGNSHFVGSILRERTLPISQGGQPPRPIASSPTASPITAPHKYTNCCNAPFCTSSVRQGQRWHSAATGVDRGHTQGMSGASADAHPRRASASALSSQLRPACLLAISSVCSGVITVPEHHVRSLETYSFQPPGTPHCEVVGTVSLAHGTGDDTLPSSTGLCFS